MLLQSHSASSFSKKVWFHWIILPYSDSEEAVSMDLYSVIATGNFSSILLLIWLMSSFFGAKRVCSQSQLVLRTHMTPYKNPSISCIMHQNRSISSQNTSFLQINIWVISNSMAQKCSPFSNFLVINIKL